MMFIQDCKDSEKTFKEKNNKENHVVTKNQFFIPVILCNIIPFLMFIICLVLYLLSVKTLSYDMLVTGYVKDFNVKNGIASYSVLTFYHTHTHKDNVYLIDTVHLYIPVTDERRMKYLDYDFNNTNFNDDYIISKIEDCKNKNTTYYDYRKLIRDCSNFNNKNRDYLYRIENCNHNKNDIISKCYSLTKKTEFIRTPANLGFLYTLCVSILIIIMYIYLCILGAFSIKFGYFKDSRFYKVRCYSVKIDSISNETASIDMISL